MDYKLNKAVRMKKNPDGRAEEILELIDLRFRAVKRLMEDNDLSLLHITTFYINSLQHFFWDGEYTLEGWKIIDEHVGDLLDESENVMLMSDHGSNPIETVFHINTWLEDNGYLQQDTRVANTLDRVGLRMGALIDFAELLRVRNLAAKWGPEWLINKIPNVSGEMKRGAKADSVDWVQTQALASGQGPVYLTVDESAYEPLQEELIERLGEITGPNGNPIASAVHRGEDVYSGKYTDEAPDIVIEQASNVHITSGVGRDEPFTDPETEDWKAENKRHGLFAAIGSDFTTGEIGSLSILDLAPSLLHLHGCPIPSAIDGTPRPELFAEDCEASSREPDIRPLSERVSDISEMDNDIQGRVEDLGYLE